MSIKVSDDQNTVTYRKKNYVAKETTEFIEMMGYCDYCDLNRFFKLGCNAPCNDFERKDNRNVIFKLKSEVENELD